MRCSYLLYSLIHGRRTYEIIGKKIFPIGTRRIVTSRRRGGPSPIVASRSLKSLGPNATLVADILRR